jgi:hypothetical protein
VARALTPAIDKHALLRELVILLEQEVARAIETADRTRAGAVHEEARPENDKDTRALEQTYLARGQALRVVDLQQALKQVQFMEIRSFGPDDAIGLSALVELACGDETRWVFFAPAGGGKKIQHVDVITPEAPLGQALTGKYCDEEFVLRGKEYVIVALH